MIYMKDVLYEYIKIHTSEQSSLGRTPDMTECPVYITEAKNPA